MNLSVKKQTELYNAISDEITKMRISQKGKYLEEELSYMQNRIWNNIVKVLKLDD